MHLMLGQGIKCTFLLTPKTSRYFFKLPLLLHNNDKIHTRLQIQHLASVWQWHHPYTFNNPCHKRLESDRCLKSILCKYSSKSDSSSKSEISNKQCYDPPVEEKLSIFQKMKQMTKKYWHILIPVHLVTSLGWTSAFYVAAKNGVDIIGILESLNLSERYLELVRGSNAGHWAVTYALYKVFTPLRYTVTVGGTTMTIRYLKKWGYIKLEADSKLVQSKKCAEGHKATYGKSNIPSKNTQPNSHKT